VVDTGAQTSVIAASTVQQLVSSGAITDGGVLTCAVVGQAEHCQDG
jgi:hypothetical protein